MQTYTDAEGAKQVVFPEPQAAMSLYRALMEAIEADHALEKAKADMPDYRPTSPDIDYYGAELSAFNRAVAEFGYQLGIKD